MNEVIYSKPLKHPTLGDLVAGDMFRFGAGDAAALYLMSNNDFYVSISSGLAFPVNPYTSKPVYTVTEADIKIRKV